METSTEKILNDVLDLPQQVRAFLAEKLLENLEEEETSELSEEWKNEISRRCKEIDEDRAVMLDAEDVFNKAFRALE